MKKITIIKAITIAIFVAGYTVVSAAPLSADQTPPQARAANPVEALTGTQPGTQAGKQQRWAVFPIIASSPETGLQLGAMLFHFFPVQAPAQQASMVDIKAFATTEEQYQVSLSPNIFFHNNRFRLNTAVYYASWTANYYGLGNDAPDESEEYQSKSLGATLTLEMKLAESFIVGLLGSFSTEDISTEAGGRLQTDNVIGATDADYAGVGIRVGYDSRDNINAPHAGGLAAYESTWFTPDVGSDQDFTLQTLDLRYYNLISRDRVLALSAQLKNSHGQVPFRFLPSPDGTLLLRGIENGRYRDNLLLGFQSEYRFPVRGKFSGTVFAEMAQVANEYRDLKASSFKTSVGAGIRYALNAAQRFNLRADIAWVDDGLGVIIFVREAF